MNNRPSQAYEGALEDCKKHHSSSKTYSGKLLRPHAPFIKALIDQMGCKSVLDFGAGKGSQYEWVMPQHDMTIEQWWGVPVTKYDPAWPPYAAEPVGTFDLVICTHTLGAIPESDRGWVVDRLYSLANKAIYVAEKIGETKKKVFKGAGEPPVVTPEDWQRILERETKLEVVLATREKRDGGVQPRSVWLVKPGVWEDINWGPGVRPLDISWA